MGRRARTRRAWYEPLDYATRVTSRNHRQVAADDDGLVRVVLAGRDPGTANWLDTEGRPEVLTTVRWFRPPEHAARSPPRSCRSPTSTSRLPDGHPRVDADARRAEIAARAAHVAWRYRT